MTITCMTFVKSRSFWWIILDKNRIELVKVLWFGGEKRNLGVGICIKIFLD
jgi:hypothetical protein